MPIFEETRYYYLPYEPENTAKYIVDEKEYDILNNNNGKIIIADMQTNEIIKTYQDTKYCGLSLLYADEDNLFIAVKDESNETFNKVCILNDDMINYYDIYEKIVS